MKAAFAATLLVLTTVRLTAATFVDSEIDLSAYTQSIYDSNSAGITISVTQCPSCGNPGKAVSVAYTFNPASSPSFLTFVGLLQTSWVWNPSVQGEITGLDFSIDKFVQSTPPPPGPTSTSLIPLLFQDGKYYAAFLFPTIQPATWLTGGGNGLQPGNFELLDFTTGARNNTVHPDFSGAGQPITFGFAIRLNNTPNLTSAEIRQDNVAFRITAVPEPSTLSLVALAMTGAAMRAKRRRNRAAPQSQPK